MWSRRTFLSASGLTLASGALPRIAQAGSTDELRFLFVYCYGGWDPTQVFATEFDNRNVDMPSGAELATLGDLQFVHHDSRPTVSSFFEAWGDRCRIINGVMVPSIAHVNCMRLSMTGTAADGAPDWPAILASAHADRYALPHLVVGGPSFGGDLGSAVTRAGSSGQLEGLLSGEILDESDLRAGRPGSRAEDILDDYLARRVSAALDAARDTTGQALVDGYGTSLTRARDLKDLLHVVDWSAGSGLSDQLSTAVSALSMGICRCATVSYTGDGWDSHTNNDDSQSGNFEGLFSGLVGLMSKLQNATTSAGDSLLDRTVVVVMSEMGRTPQLNSADGKDHWPFTSVLLVAPGLSTGRTVGGFDSYYYGQPLDAETGEISEDGIDLTSATLGATLLDMAGLDPGEFLPGYAPIPGVLV